jgi:serine/threonine protein kinase
MEPHIASSLICPLTRQIFAVPVLADDGFTYEQSAIIAWIQEKHTSPKTGQELSLKSLRPNHAIKGLIEEFENSLRTSDYRFKLDVDIRKEPIPMFRVSTKAIYRAEWITRRNAPPTIVLKINGVQAKREASFCVQLSRHPHVIRTYGMVEPASQDSIMLLQEYAPQGSLHDLLDEQPRVPDELVLIEMFSQVADAMTYLAHNRVIHGDLACRNILVFRFNKYKPEDNLVKLTDFGLTRHSSIYVSVNNGSMVNDCIPIRYSSPELIQDQESSEKSDVFSMGVTMWEAFSKTIIPWSTIETDKEICQRVTSGETLSKPITCSDETWSVILTAMIFNAPERPTFSQLRRSLAKLQYLLENLTRSHMELMNKFQQVLQVDMGQVTDGIAVEQTLVNLSRLNIDQTGATFRRILDTNITVFRLRIPDDNDLETFGKYYGKHFKDFIIRHEQEQTTQWIKIRINTNILYNHMVSIICQ